VSVLVACDISDEAGVSEMGMKELATTLEPSGIPARDQEQPQKSTRRNEFVIPLLSRKSRPLRSSLARFAVIGAIASLGIILLLAVTIYGLSEFQLSRTPELPSATVTGATDASAIERGSHLALTRGCTGCHGEDFGGRVLIDVPAFAVIAANNLTAGLGGIPADYDDLDWERAIRHGVGHDGRQLALMPSDAYFSLGDADVASLIGYFESLPPVDRELPQRRFGAVGRTLVAFGRLPIFSASRMQHDAARPPVPPEAATVEYGRYLAATCTGCHGADFTGGRIAGSPASHPSAPNLTPDVDEGLGAWHEDDFVRALRTGRRPDGSEISSRYMPWQATARMTEVEIRALWMYLRSLPATGKGDT
jgi:cytochrome c553